MHKLFAKQLAKARLASGAVDIDALGTLVSAAYEEADCDRRRTDRSIALMMEEVDQLNRGLECLVDERTAELQSVRSVLEAALNNMSQGLLMFDAQARLVICNRRYLGMYALDPEAVKPGCHLRDLLQLRAANGTFSGDPESYIEALLQRITAKHSETVLVELADGRTMAVLNHPTPDGGWVATHEDITERRRAEKQIFHMARHDALTDLPNRVQLRERLAHALADLGRGDRLAVHYLDLDHFKSVNDTLGHPVGDELLQAIATRLRSCLKETDTVARVGGDEFAIIQGRIDSPADAAKLARAVRNVLHAPYDLKGHAVIVDTSVGIAVAPDDGTDPTELIKNADMALYGAKSDGRNTYCFFEPEMDARMKARRTLELALRSALEASQFELFYQPIVTLHDGRVSCCEALLRWHHAERGTISPAEFIPVAEEIGLIVPLGEWLLRKACTDATRWPDDVKVAVNLSPIQIMNQNLLPMIVNALAASGLPANRLELEITEAVLMQNSEQTLGTLHQLRALGVHISMDDFGTGYSSLSYLRSFPFDKIKIDRCFISGLAESEESVAIVRAVAGLASSLNMRTTAEGVETTQQMQRVQALGCTEMQGYLFSRPQPLEAVTKLLVPPIERRALIA
ncbi:MAG: putative bifunctional diguanylate cyclase/phosphodiesterase [Xanthobacteraceae bacterium]